MFKKFQLIVSISFLYLLFSCSKNDNEQLAYDNLKTAIKTDFEPYILANEDSTAFEEITVFDWCAGEYNRFGANEIDSFKLHNVNQLKENYQHHEYLIVFKNFDPSNHWTFPPIEKQGYLPDSIFKEYNKFSELYNSYQISWADTGVFKYFRDYLNNIPPPFNGYTAKAEISWFLGSKEYFDELYVEYDTTYKVKKYYPECMAKFYN